MENWNRRKCVIFWWWIKKVNSPFTDPTMYKSVREYIKLSHPKIKINKDGRFTFIALYVFKRQIVNLHFIWCKLYFMSFVVKCFFVFDCNAFSHMNIFHSKSFLTNMEISSLGEVFFLESWYLCIHNAGKTVLSSTSSCIMILQEIDWKLQHKSSSYA